MKQKRKKKKVYVDDGNWDFYTSSSGLFGVCNVHGRDLHFESTTKSGLMRKLNHYLKHGFR